MRPRHANRVRRPAPTSRLELQPLEDRWCPSCNLPDPATFAGGVLTINGDDLPNRVLITDDGGGNIAVSCDNEQEQVVFGGVSKVVLNTGGGDDAVNYDHPGLGAGEQIEIDLGPGNDGAQIGRAHV